MKANWRFVTICVVIVLGVLIVAFLYFVSYTNSSLADKYPAIPYRSALRLHDPNMNDNTTYFNGTDYIVSYYGKTLWYDPSTRSFLCNGKQGRLIGSSVINCGDSYWIYYSGDASPFSVSGPFFFNESADFLKQLIGNQTRTFPD